MSEIWRPFYFYLHVLTSATRIGLCDSLCRQVFDRRESINKVTKSWTQRKEMIKSAVFWLYNINPCISWKRYQGDTNSEHW